MRINRLIAAIDRSLLRSLLILRDCRGQACEFEKAVADAARRDEQKRQHHAYTKLREQKEKCRRNHLADICGSRIFYALPPVPDIAIDKHIELPESLMLFFEYTDFFVVAGR